MIEKIPEQIPKMPALKRALGKWPLERLRWATVAAVVIISAVVSACTTTQNVRLPTITAQPSHTVMHGKFVWFDLLTEDVKVAKQFYGGLFGWQFDTLSGADKYVLITNQGKRVGGMVVASNNDTTDSQGSIWIGAISVRDVDRSVAEVVQQGGTVIEGPLTAGDRGRMAVIRDNTDALVVLLRATGGDPPDSPLTPGNWVWADLFTPDMNAAKEFYTRVIGYELRDHSTESGVISKIMFMDEKMRSSIIEIHWDGIESNWLPYIRVSDISETIKRANQLGGTLLLRHGNTAILKDPAGAAIGIQGSPGE